MIFLQYRNLFELLHGNARAREMLLHASPASQVAICEYSTEIHTPEQLAAIIDAVVAQTSEKNDARDAQK